VIEAVRLQAELGIDVMSDGNTANPALGRSTFIAGGGIEWPSILRGRGV
jgi:hypothetical protein